MHKHFFNKKDLFFKLKGFDSNFNSANAEDSEFGFRLLKEGFKILLEKKLMLFIIQILGCGLLSKEFLEFILVK